MEKYYTCEEVATMYAVKVTTVWSWIRSGKLTAVKLGSIYRVRAEDLKKFETEV